MNWITFPRFKIEEEKQPKKKESDMKDFIMYFIVIFGLMFVCFGIGRKVEQSIYREKLQDKQIELNICNATMGLFKEDLDKFCAERFEKMGC